MPAAGVPASAPVAELKVTPEGKLPDSESAGVGKPDAVTVKELTVPTVNFVREKLVMLET